MATAAALSQKQAAHHDQEEPEQGQELLAVERHGDGRTCEDARTPAVANTATTNQIALQQMCERGMGIACLFYADVQPALERGALMRVLPRWSLTSRPVTMVTPKRDGVPAKVRVAMNALERHFATLPNLPRT